MPEWALIVFRHHMRSTRFMRESRITTNIAHLSARRFSAVEFPVPPLSEQKRIVAAVEEQFSRLDAGVAALERARKNLTAMRAAAFESVIHGDFPSVTLDSLGDGPGAIIDGPFGSNLKTQHYTPSGPRVIRLQNIGDGDFIDARAHIAPEHFARLQRHAVEAGDLVCAILGAVLPRAVIIPSGVGPAIVKADCPRIRITPSVNTAFVWGVLNAPSTRRMVGTKIKGVGRPRLTLSELRQVPVPLPGRAEQDRRAVHLVEELERISRLDTQIAIAQRRAEMLRSAILAAAFSGKLVSQNADDEPAAMLLERIAGERAASNGYGPMRIRGPRARREQATS